MNAATGVALVRRMLVCAVAAVIVVGTVPAGAAEAAGRKTTPAAYAHAVCTDLSSWLANLRTGQDAFNTAVADATTIPQVKGMLVQFLDAALITTVRARKAIERAGVPDAKDGTKAAASIKQAFSKLEVTFKHARDSAKKLSTKSEAAFVKRARKISAAINDGAKVASQAVGFASARFNHAEITAAGQSDPACSDVSS